MARENIPAKNRVAICRRMSRTVGLRPGTGFSLLEVMISIAVLTIGLTALLGLFATSLATMSLAQKDLIAKQKAEDALESIYSARNTGQTSFDSVQNVSNGGVFLDGLQPLLNQGPDGLLGTADDDTTKPDELVLPGPDGLLGTGDDIHVPLTDFKRQIVIAPVFRVGAVLNPDLRQVTVTVQYATPGFGMRTYKVGAYVSRFR